jgi:hypothetical protein
MAILALFRWQADPDALVAAYGRELKDAPSVTLDQPKRTLRALAPGRGRAVVVDLWDSEEEFHRMATTLNSSGTSRGGWVAERAD